MKTIEIDGVIYQFRRVKGYGLPFADGLYPEQLAIEKTKQRRKKSKREIQIDYLDELWRQLIHIEWGNRCAVCRKRTGKLDPHHIIGRRNLRLRWDSSNGILLCAYHHTLNSKMSAHGAPEAFREWFIGTYGKNRWDTLHIIANMRGKDPDLELVKIQLKQELKNPVMRI